MTPAELAEAVERAAPALAPCDVRRCDDPSRADYVCVDVLRAEVRDRRALAAALAAALRALPGVATVEVAEPGFLNLRVTEAAVRATGHRLRDQQPVLDAAPLPAGWAQLAGVVGADVAALLWALQPDLDPRQVDREQALRRTWDNPAFRVLHAHAYAALLARSPRAAAAASPREHEVRVRVAEVAGPTCDTPRRTGRRLLGLATAFFALAAAGAADACARDVRAALAVDLARLGIAAPERI